MIGALIGALGGALGTSALLGKGGTKKEQRMESIPKIETHEKMYSPVYTYSPQIQLESPEATQTKKERITSEPEQKAIPKIRTPLTQTAEDTPDIMSNLIWIGAMGVGGLILYKSLT